ncbi:hypothetical protein GCM10022393_11360 [Aquimarina addita]|uniref:DUF4178 domain-containing protein n=1 Tax=Aquimarina addita TaxID=870485 RepID=A0ABP7XET3_9FLAO
MGLFDIFKKKEEERHYDATNIRVVDLQPNFILDYDLDSWIVKKMYEYDWGDNFFTREFLINNGKSNLYLHIEEDDELEIAITKKIGLRVLGEHISDVIEETGKPPKKITYDDEIYYRDSEDMGYVRNVEDDNWSELISWTYLTKNEEKLINIEQTGETNFEASIGEYIQEFKISNILPQNN